MAHIVLSADRLRAVDPPRVAQLAGLRVEG